MNCAVFPPDWTDIYDDPEFIEESDIEDLETQFQILLDKEFFDEKHVE